MKLYSIRQRNQLFSEIKKYKGLYCGPVLTFVGFHCTCSTFHIIYDRMSSSLYIVRYCDWLEKIFPHVAPQRLQQIKRYWRCLFVNLLFFLSFLKT